MLCKSNTDSKPGSHEYVTVRASLRTVLPTVNAKFLTLCQVQSMLSSSITSKSNTRGFTNIHKRSLSDPSPYLVCTYTHSTDASGRDPLAQLQFKSTKLSFHENLQLNASDKLPELFLTGN